MISDPNKDKPTYCKHTNRFYCGVPSLAKFCVYQVIRNSPLPATPLMHDAWKRMNIA